MDAQFLETLGAGCGLEHLQIFVFFWSLEKTENRMISFQRVSKQWVDGLK
jgi:hypothetical protein